MPFAHLHVHTEYSLLDGCCRISELIDAAKELGQAALAITDHGVMYGAVEFYKAAKKAGIKPIIGCEVYVASGSRFNKEKLPGNEYHHLVLLCKNETGYKNLIKLVSAGFTEGFYSKPRIDKEILAANSEGLIALSACLAGELPRLILNGQTAKAKETALWFKNVFGSGNYYLELQNHGIEAQQKVNAELIKISAETGIECVATNDVHYIKKCDSEAHKVLLCIQTGRKITEENPLEFETDEFYLKSESEMAALFPESAVQNTAKIADMCNFDFEFGNIKLPVFDIGTKNHFEYFKEKCLAGLYKNYGNNPPKSAFERLDYELSVINRMGYVDYYLIVADFVNYAKQNGIPVGPGRGSGAASIAAYCIGITGVDPLKYNLLFERFLNPERVSMPDFDIDFCYVNRQKVIDYVVNKYGRSAVAQIVTFGTMAARAAVRDVGRAMDLPYATCDKVAKLIPQAMKITISEALEKSPELKTVYNENPAVKAVIDMAARLEGMPRNASTHAAGVVIADRPLNEYVPLSKNDDAIVTQYTMTALEELGLLKMDFLGLRNITILSDAEKSIKKTNPGFSVASIPENDKQTLTMLAKGFTDGVFQLESEGMKSVLRQFVPENLEDIIAILSLYRPGPMDAIPTYIHNRHNPQDITYLHPLLEPILKGTYGCIVYQEQVMQICVNLAGYSLGRADIVRRAISKKKHDVMEKERHAFIYGEKDSNGNTVCEGAAPRGIPEDIASAIFDNMASFASYAFNKGHATAYAVISYQTAYLKCHYPAEYMAALFSCAQEGSAKVLQYTAECRRLNIKLLPPNINKSLEGFSAEAGAVRFGLSFIRNVGANLCANILSERKNGIFSNFSDFVFRCSSRELNRRALESLINSGALDSLEFSRKSMLFNLDSVLNAAESAGRFANAGQMDLFGNLNSAALPIEPLPEMEKSELLRLEKDATGLYFSGHPLENYLNYAAKCGASDIAKISGGTFKDGARVTVLCLLYGIKIRTIKGNRIIGSAFAEDMSGQIEITFFQNFIEQNKPSIIPDAPILLTGKISERDTENAEIICEKITLLTPAQETAAPKPKVYIKVPSIDSQEFTALKTALAKCKGQSSVIICDENSGKRFAAPDSLNFNPTPQNIEKIIEIVGKNNVKTVE